MFQRPTWKYLLSTNIRSQAIVHSIGEFLFAEGVIAEHARERSWGAPARKWCRRNSWVVFLGCKVERYECCYCRKEKRI